MTDQDPYDTPYPTNQPAAPAPSSDPWTADELAQSQNWANQYFTSHQIPSSYGTPDDIANSYVQFRRGGMSHADAMAKLQTVPAQLGWDKYKAPGPDAPPPATGGTTTTTPTPTPTSDGAPPPSAGTQSAPSVGPGTSAPNYTPPPAYTPSVQPFQYSDFQDPTADDVLNDKGYQFERDQGLSAIGANRAAAGTLNTGGTLKDYVGFANNLASTHYNDLYSRKKATYDTNRAGAFAAWQANNGLGKDTYDENYRTQYADPFAFDMQGAGLNQNNNQFNASLGQNNNQFNTTLGFNKWLEDYKRSTLDPFDMKYKTLSML